jgi:hypothetical protein
MRRRITVKGRVLSLAALLLLAAMIGVVPVALADNDDDDNGGGPTIVQCPPSATSVNLVANGSFEVVPEATPFRPLASGDPGIPPWVVSGDFAFPVDHVGTYWQAAHGVHSMDMEGFDPIFQQARGILTQDVLTEPGEEYSLCFAYAANPDNCPRPNDQIQVSFRGLPAGGLDASIVTANCEGRSHADMGWVYRAVTVTGSGGLDELRFESLTTGQHGVALDDVSLVSLDGDDDDGDDDDTGDDDDNGDDDNGDG